MRHENSAPAQGALGESQAEFKDWYENAPVALFSIGVDGRIRRCNRCAGELLGYAVEELTGRPVFDLCADTPQGKDKASELFQRFQTGEEIHDETLQMQKADGTLIWIGLSVNAVRDAQGRVVESRSMVVDITEWVRTEEALRKAKLEKDAILNSLVEHVIYEDTEMRILWPNRAACESAGIAREELIGRNCYEIWPKRSEPCPDCPVVEAIETGQPQEVEKITPDGRAWFIRGYPVRDESSDVIGAVEVTLEITQRKQAEEALHRSLEKMAHGQRLLLALSHAAQAMQRARTPDAVYRAIGEHAVGLGFEVAIFTLSDDRRHLIVSHLTLKSDLVRAAEKLTGLSAEGYRFPLSPGGFFQRIVAGGETVFSHLDAAPFAEALPRSVQPLAGRLAGLLGWKQSIIAPLAIGGEVQGLLAVVAADLAESDVPAVTAFANQAAIAIENARLYKETQQLAAFNESIIQSTAEGIVVENAEGFLTFVNPAAAMLLGYAPDELVGLHWTAIIPPDQQPIVQAADERRVRGKADRYELELVRKDGGRISVLVSGNPRFDAEGHFAGTMAVFTDITERKQAEEALRASEAWYRMLMDSANDAIFIADAETGMLLDANRSAQRMTGRSLDEIKQMHQLALHPAGEREQYETLFREYALAGSAVAHGLYVVNRDGDRTPVDVSANAIEIEGRRFIQGIFRDVTERVQAEKALRESEQEYRTLVERSLQGIVVVQDSRIVFANTAFAQMTGYTIEEILSLSPEEVRALIHPEDQAFVWGRFRDRLAGKPVPPQYEYRGIGKDGTVLWLEMSAGRIEYDGKPAIQGITVDITERKRSEEEREVLLAHIRAQARQMQQIIETVPEGMVLLDAEGRVLQANPVAEKDLADLADARVGGIITHLGDRTLAELLTSPPTKGLWHEIKMDGRTFEVIARPMEKDPELENWVLVIRDVTWEREIERHTQERERLAAVGQLAAGVAHDFNNIMAIIILYTGMGLRLPELPPKLRERLEIISGQAKRATTLIQQLLDFSRRAVLERHPMDLVPFLKEVVKLLERIVPESIEIGLTYGVDEYTVSADPTRVEQAILNLAINARDAMPEGGELRIALSRTAETDEIRCAICGQVVGGEWIRIAVTDTGSGIPPDVLPHIFEPFFTTKEVGKGTGLGLAQVYGIAERHEGHVDVTTKVGEGTTFVLYLPALLEHRPEAPTRETETFVQGQGETILVVEDDATLRKALADTLELLNYRVLEAANGREALDMLEQRASEIALVLSDLVMPEMGGQALFHAMRQRGLTLPVVMLSGHPMKNELESQQRQGLAGWLLKPPSPEQLAQLLAQALSGDAD